MRLHWLFPAVCAMALAAGRAQEPRQPGATPTLQPGMQAPPLQVSRWPKGGPVAELKDRVFLVVFLATWSAPCRAAIPHLSALQRRHAEHLTVVAVASRDPIDTIEQVTKFATDPGNSIAFSVAFDDGARTNAAWMQAAGQEVIPTAFLVSRDGTLLWIGPPMLVELVLAEALAGTLTAARAAELRAAMEQRLRTVLGRCRRDPKQGLPEMAAWLEQQPFLCGIVEAAAFEVMLADHPAEAQAIGARVVDRAIARQDVAALNGVAWAIVDPAGRCRQKDLALAERAAKAALAASGERDPDVLDTWARVLFCKHDVEGAIAAQKKAIALLANAKDAAPARAGLTTVLLEYEAALQRGK
jgi:thiol-disulfide isomerase/thioredoxin